MTILRERTSRSYQFLAGGRLAMNSAGCRERTVSRSTYPSSDGVNSTLGGYAIASSCVLKLVMTIQNSGATVKSAYRITSAAEAFFERAETWPIIVPSPG